MKVDLQFPPAPQYGQAPLRCDDVKPPRERALQRLARIAEAAEGMRGIVVDGTQPFGATSKGFAMHCVVGAFGAWDAGSLTGRAGFLLTEAKIKQADAEALENVMLINPRQYWGTLGPIRGDIVICPNDFAAVVVKPLCNGCQDFEAVSLCDDGDGLVTIGQNKQWMAGVKWIIRVIDESPWSEAELAAMKAAEEAKAAAEKPVTEAAPVVADIASPEVRAAVQAEGEAPPPADADTTRPKRRTGVR